MQKDEDGGHDDDDHDDEGSLFRFHQCFKSTIIYMPLFGSFCYGMTHN